MNVPFVIGVVPSVWNSKPFVIAVILKCVTSPLSAALRLITRPDVVWVSSLVVAFVTDGVRATPVMFVGSEAESSDASSSPPPMTVAVFVTLRGEFWSGVTGIVIAGKFAPERIAAVLVHVTVWLAVLQVQPPPVAVPGVRPTGNMSVIVVIPLVAAGPSLLGVTV